ncbi:MAG: CARDB domain-containing protein [bacterium]
MKNAAVLCFLMMFIGINISQAEEQSLMAVNSTDSVPVADISVRDVTFKLISTTLNDLSVAQPEDTVLIQGIIENIGTANYISDFNVQLLWGTTTIASKSIPGLSAGEATIIEAEKTFLCEQAQGVTIKASSDDTNQENNEKTISVDEFSLHGNLLPDLSISNISLAGHYVYLTVENNGQGMVASGKVAVHVFIDGKMQGGLGSSYFDSLTFRRPGGRKGINTGFSISGTHTIRAVIDPEPFNMINESDEKNNVATATIIAPLSTRDLVITNIDYNPEYGIVPVVSNQGSTQYAPGTMIKVNIRVNKQQVSVYTHTLDTSLEPKTNIRLIPPVPIKIKETSRVFVHVEPIPENLDDENINNIMEKKIQLL